MVSRYVIYFTVFSFIGYLYECLAMVLWTGKWDNRGFLFGPVIPIYGAGALLGTLLFEYVITSYTPLKVFLWSVGASAVLEYVVHYGLEKIFHAYWWDYSKAPFNINGRICLPASLGFGIAGLLIIYVFDPAILPLLRKMPDELAQFVALLFTVILSADLTLTISTLSDFIRRVETFDTRINERMDSFVDNHLDESRAIGERFYSAVDQIEEKRKRFTDRWIDRAVDSMSSGRRYIITRIKGFKGSRHSSRLNEVLKKIKERIKRNEDE